MIYAIFRVRATDLSRAYSIKISTEDGVCVYVCSRRGSKPKSVPRYIPFVALTFRYDPSLTLGETLRRALHIYALDLRRGWYQVPAGKLEAILALCAPFPVAPGPTADAGNTPGHTADAGNAPGHTADAGNAPGHTADAGNTPGPTVDTAPTIPAISIGADPPAKPYPTEQILHKLRRDAAYSKRRKIRRFAESVQSGTSASGPEATIDSCSKGHSPPADATFEKFRTDEDTRRKSLTVHFNPYAGCYAIPDFRASQPAPSAPVPSAFVLPAFAPVANLPVPANFSQRVNSLIEEKREIKRYSEELFEDLERSAKAAELPEIFQDSIRQAKAAEAAKLDRVFDERLDKIFQDG